MLIKDPRPNLPPSEPKKAKKPSRMTPALAVLLHGTPEMPYGLLQLQMASALQICRLFHWTQKMGSFKYVKGQFHDLVSLGYVEIDRVPTKLGKSPHVYMLSKKGINFLAELGYDVNTAYRPDKDTNRQGQFIDHTLAVNDVIVAAAMLKKVDPNYWLESFVHERVLKHQPYRITWRSEEIRLIPDGILTFNYYVGPKHVQTPVLLEHESSEKGQFAFRRKVRGYIELLKGELYDKGITITYTTTLGIGYLRRMREWTWQELDSTHEPAGLGRLFLFTMFDKPTLEQPIDVERLWLEPVWYTPYNDPPTALLGG